MDTTRNHLDTTTAQNPLVKLVDQLSKQAAIVHALLQKEIAEINPSEPDNQLELDAILKIFAENHEQIKALLADQVTTVEELLEIGGRL